MLPTALILITPVPFGASLISEKPCLANSFYGSFNGQSIFNTSPTCFAAIPKLDSGVIIPTYHPIQQLVWIQKQSVDEALWRRENTTSLSALDQLFNRLSTPEPSLTESRAYEDQQVLITSESDAHSEILYRTSSAALLSLNPAAARVIDTILPPFYKSSLLPTSNVSYVPVPEDKVEAVKRLLSSLKFDPVVASVVNSVSIPQMKRDIRYLTGEDEDSPILSRHSFAAGSRIAAAWLKENFEATGATCELKGFLVGFAPNVIWCEHYSDNSVLTFRNSPHFPRSRYPSTVETSATVILSAHYDSRGSFGSTKAPGGDDDGSGVVALMGIAWAIFRKGLTFRSNVELIAFAGEEQVRLV
jgi:Peptidase family M28